MNNNDIQTRWYNPVNRLGRITLAVAMLLSFLPFLYLVFAYDVFPPLDAMGLAYVNLAAAFGASWIVEPLSYFPALGTAGTYMGILAGSIGQMRVPASLVAKSVAGVEENTQEAEIVGTCGIAGSVLMNCLIVALTAAVGAYIIPHLPKSVMAALSAYILPALFGAVMAMFTTEGKVQIAVLTLLCAVGLNWMNMNKMLPPIVGIFILPMCVVIGVLISRFFYKKGWAK